MGLLIDEFLQLRDSHPVVDVRSENEYIAGHIPHAVNIPILNNEERKAVGTDYKQKGRDEAIKTGFKLVGPRLVEIINQTGSFSSTDILVHCWRGGMRSNNFCQFVGMAGIKTRSLVGGYKAYRQKALESFRQPYHFLVIGGCTGSGKSQILRALKDRGEQIIDLETLASHRGSVFGGLMMPPQPTTEQFQNNLFEEISALDPGKRIWVEDESIAVGKIFLPEDFWFAMNRSPVIELNVSKEARISRLVEEYGGADRQQFLEAMKKIEKKLGGLHFKAAREKLSQGEMASTIEILLTYYDRAYLTGLGNKKDRIKERLAWDGNDVAIAAGQLINSPVNA